MSPRSSRPGRGCGCLAGVAVLVVAWLVTGGLALFETAREVTGTEAPPGPGPAPDPGTLSEGWKAHPGSLREFSREETARRYRLTFGFVDYHGRTHRVSCLVDRAAHAAERAGFGYDPEAVYAELNGELAQLADAEISARGLGAWFQIEFHGAGGHRWSWNLPGGMEAVERSRALAAIEEMKAWLERELPRHDDRIRAAIYKRRGLLVEGKTLSIDYERLIREGTDPLSDCFDALRASGRGTNVRQFMGLLLAFYQELGYEIPPDEEEGRRTLGLRVPTDVLVSGRGDCDSKSVAFAAMWRRLPARLVFILVPGHALVGVEAPALPGEETVRVGNRTFVLCEVAGPAKIAPGAKSVSGSFEYVLVEPA